ncbi:MAG TPA: ATP-binding protein [Polyangiaceae bacterium]|jgi:PAS domain S-box-containing protein|nr:ATP-binding protein [Polyangiaceae bacterium]
MSEAKGQRPPDDDPRQPDSSPAPATTRPTSNASQDRYRALIEAADEAIIVADFDSGRCLEANPAACELFGYTIDDLYSRTVTSLLSETDPEAARVTTEIRERERAHHPNLGFVKNGGTAFLAELRAKVFESDASRLVLFMVRDVSLRVEREEELARAYQSLKEAQAKLLHSGKLAAIGQIAGGVAHEVNNPATFILTNLRVLRDHVGVLRATFSRLRRLVERPDPSPGETHATVDAMVADGSIDALLREANEMVDDNLAGIERIASIVADLRTFSRIEQDDVRQVTVNDLVDVACNLGYADIRHRARLIKELKRLPPVSAEPGKLAQVFTTLLVNAAHSIEEGAANENEIRVSTDLEDGFVVVAVQDTGTPVPEPARKRLFQPFYETSGRDYGSGIGLSLCAEIVRLHGGTIALTSVGARGNRFEVRLPAMAVRPSSLPPLKPSPRAPRGTGARARVLVIDDDVAVLRAYRRMLGTRHDVVLATGGAHGLTTLANDTGFDLILCDVMMPEVDGPMVYDALVARFPAVVGRVVFCSGGAFTPRAKAFLGSVDNPFLSKPIDQDALERMIQEGYARRHAAST